MMSLQSTLLAAVAAISLAGAATADMAKIMVDDAYARSAGATAMSGAAFMVLNNHSDQDDRLIAAHSVAAAKVELHTHVQNADGVMQMREIEDGIALPAGGMHMLQRGGDHVMFMGLTNGWAQGDLIPLTLVFEGAGEITIEVPVDLDR